MRRSGSGSLSRRDFVKTGLTAVAVLPVAGAALLRAGEAHAEDKLVTDMPENAVLVSALQYVNESAKPDQNCAKCMQFTAQGDGTHGKCALFATGVVSAKGWCASFVPKVS